VPVIPPAGTQKASSLTGVVGAATVGGSNTELNSSSVRMNNGKAALLADKVEVFIQSNSSLVDPASVATTDIMSKSGVGSGTSQVVSKRNDNVSSTEKKTVTSSKASLSKNIGVTTGITNASKVAIKKKGNTTATKKKTKTKGSTTVAKLGNSTTNSNYKRPPLSKLINGWDIIGDTQFLMNFAVLGHAKCGTSTFMHWLRQHPEVQVTANELQHLLTGKPAKMIKTLYTKLPAGPYQYGYKNPTDVEQVHVLEFFQMFWPKAGLIVGLRHPVRWFESFYNFRVQNWNELPHANDLIGRCTSGTKMTCTHRARFHWHLYTMHKTNLATDPLTKQIRRKKKMLKAPLANRVFLYDTKQLADTNETRIAQFRTDVQHFLNLKEEMPPIPHYSPGSKPLEDKAEQDAKDAKKIDICSDEFIPLRQDLMKHARGASEWILNYFLDAPGVVVSSRDHFREILLEWNHDPCDKMQSTNTTT
jgi:hypothetical protein